MKGVLKGVRRHLPALVYIIKTWLGQVLTNAANTATNQIHLSPDISNTGAFHTDSSQPGN